MSNPKLFAEKMRLYLGANYLNTWNCALEEFELFGSTKRILDLPHGSKFDSRWLDKVNHSTLAYVQCWKGHATRGYVSMMQMRCLVPLVYWSLNAMNSNDIFCNGHIRPRKNVKHCRLTLDIHTMQSREGCTWHTCANFHEYEEYNSNNNVPCNLWFRAYDINWCVRRARRNECLIGQIFLLYGRWRLIQTLHMRRYSHWWTMDCNLMWGSFSTATIKDNGEPSIPRSICCIPSSHDDHPNTRFAKAIHRNMVTPLLQHLWGIHYTWMDITWLVRPPFHTMVTVAS